jgi:hypothetical protein
MPNEDKIQLLARVARAKSGPAPSGDPEVTISILSLAAASYGARPADEATIPTGFDPLAVALFEAIVEGLADQLEEDGIERRIAAVAAQVHKKEHAREVLRIAALLAHSSEDVSPVERSALQKLAAALNLESSELDAALAEVKMELASGG